MSKKSQAPGGDVRPLPNNFSGSFTGSMRKSSPGKIGGAGGGNATGPELKHQRGKQGRG